jgi:hypothetical protein
VAAEYSIARNRIGTKSAGERGQELQLFYIGKLKETFLTEDLKKSHPFWNAFV